jgi:beta-phosphoglucomutase-like phosphatase (HAD superfamily)
MQLTQVGLMPYFAGYIFSGHEMPRTKPAPDVYLAAARALHVAPERCWVIEDTPTGVMAGVAAGAYVVGLCPEGDAGLPHIRHDDLRDAGACAVVSSMDALPHFLMGEGAYKAAHR